MQLSKNATTKFFSNPSMQALSKSDDTILLAFTKIKDLTSNINSLLRIRTDYLNDSLIQLKNSY